MKFEYGLLGEKLSHSYSKAIHEAFGRYGYEIFPMKKEEAESFVKSGEYKGLNVTIPYKKTVIPFCDELSPAAKKIGSVNTLIRRADGTLYGDNTDFYGFLYMADRAKIDFKDKKVLVLGSGGTSLTACAAVKSRKGSAIVISRSGENNYDNISKHKDADIIINTTPLGMYPETAASPVDLKKFEKLCGVLDVIYNPHRTRLLQQAEELCINCSGGLPMLVAQAKRAAELFTGAEIDDGEIDRIMKIILRDSLNLTLIGMPGCGKTSVGKKLARKLSREFIDIDKEVVKKAGMSIPEIFLKYGEEKFRLMEREALALYENGGGKIISTGGGAPTFEENRKNIMQNSFTVHIKRKPELLSTKGRPLSKNMNELLKMQSERLPLYEKCADYTVSNNGKFMDTVEKILEAFNENIGD